MLPLHPPTEFTALLFPLYVATSRTSVRLAGSGCVYTVEGRFFIVTAAHVANQFRGETMALRCPGGYIHCGPGEHGFFSTRGDKGDLADLAVREVLATDIAKLGRFVRFVDLCDVTQDFVIAEGMRVAFIGYPKTVNREIIALHGDLITMMLPARQVVFNDPIYKKGFISPVHICATFPRKRGYSIGVTPGQSKGPHMTPDPDGMSGGLVFRLDEEEYQKGILKVKGIIGVGIEYHRERDLLVGMHFSGVFEMLRARWPELSSKVPILNLEAGTYSLG